MAINMQTSMREKWIQVKIMETGNLGQTPHIIHGF